MLQELVPIIVQAPQRSEEWFNARLGNVTASRAADTHSYYAVPKGTMDLALQIHWDQGIDEDYIDEMSTSYPEEFCIGVGLDLVESAARRSYRQDIVTERITGIQANSDQFVSKDMIWGQYLEPFARSLYQLVYRHRVEEAPLMLHPQLMCGASPDGMVIDSTTGELGNLEIKCLKSTNHLYKIIMTDQVPDDYRDQVQMQMWISNRDWCDFVAYDSRVKEGLRIFVKRVERDDFFIVNVLEPSVRRFLAECDHDERKFAAIMKRRSNELAEQLKEMDILREVQLT